jgi:hypothetical protein
MDSRSMGALGGTDGGPVTMLYQGIHSGEDLEVEEGSYFPSGLPR